jgi:hypothetical protein
MTMAAFLAVILKPEAEAAPGAPPPAVARG